MKSQLYLLFLIGLFTFENGSCQRATLQCNQRSRSKRNTLVNPSVLPTVCSYTLDAHSNRVCQVLIEFQTFELEQPKVKDNSQFECEDFFNVGNFKICGDNTQQHLYVPMNAAGGVKTLTMSFNLKNRLSTTKWHLLVTQLECATTTQRTFQNLITQPMHFFNNNQNDIQLLAPAGCHQYYRQPSGTIKSFNYRDDSATRFLPSMNYVICVKALNGQSTIELNVQKFSLSGQINGLGFDNDCHAMIPTEGRQENYLMIPQSLISSYPNFRPTYYCGQLVSNAIITAKAPFIMYFASDDQTDASQTGFKFNYQVKSVL